MIHCSKFHQIRIKTKKIMEAGEGGGGGGGRNLPPWTGLIFNTFLEVFSGMPIIF